MLLGKSASFGIGIAKALVIKNVELQIEYGPCHDQAFEIERFYNALKSSETELSHLYDKTLQEMGAEKAQIFEAHLLMLQDPEFRDNIVSEIQSKSFYSSFAVDVVSKRLIGMFEAMDNEYMRERALDIKDISSRVLKHILGIVTPDLSHLKEDVIIVSNDITPSQMASIDLNKTVGIITEVGGKTSHTCSCGTQRGN
jgi:phosphotransferase system enzyme I (PtsI)